MFSILRRTRAVQVPANLLADYQALSESVGRSTESLIHEALSAFIEGAIAASVAVITEVQR
jgi:predicted DNA-binding protein